MFYGDDMLLAGVIVSNVFVDQVALVFEDMPSSPGGVPRALVILCRDRLFYDDRRGWCYVAVVKPALRYGVQAMIAVVKLLYSWRRVSAGIWSCC